MNRSTYSKNILKENSTDSNGISTENSNDISNVIMENSDPIDISMEYYTKPNYTTNDPNDATIDILPDLNDVTLDHSTDPNAIRMVNSTVPSGISLEDSTGRNDAIMENSKASDSQTCIIQSGFTADNLTATIQVTDGRGFRAFFRCINSKWKLFLSKMPRPNLTQNWNQSHNISWNQSRKINIDNLEHAKAAVAIWRYCSPILIVVGTIGNILSFAVMLRKKIRESTTSLYLCVLAIVDTAVLYTGLLRNYIANSYGYYIIDSSQFSCKFVLFILHGLQQFDSWVLVNIALERVCAVFVPHKVKEIFTKKFATVSLIIQALGHHCYQQSFLVH